MTHKTRIRILDQHGRFAHPEEQLDAFLLQSRPLPAESEYLIPYPICKAFSDRLLVDVAAVPIEQSSQGLLPWELACCWIDEEGNSKIRIRPTKNKKVSYNSILAHELVHAVRARLSSKKFEEFCAYDTCSALSPLPKWRKFLGPLFSSAREVLVILLLLWCNFILPFFFRLHPHPLSLLIVPALCLGLPLIRLIYRWRTWNRAAKNIHAFWPDKTYALLLRLGDDEISWLSKLPRKQVPDALHNKATHEWRWEFFVEHILK